MPEDGSLNLSITKKTTHIKYTDGIKESYFQGSQLCDD